MKALSTVNIIILFSLSLAAANEANAGLISVDNFNSGLSAGTGFAGTWADIGGETVNTANVNPLVNDSDVWYLNYGGTNDSYVHRNLSSPVSAATTQEVWMAAYMRSATVSGTLFGIEMGPASGNVIILGTEGDQYVRAGQLLGSVAAGSFTFSRGSTYTLVANRPELLVLRLYKSNLASSVFDLLDGYVDVNGNDGISNALLPIVTGQSIAAHPISQVAYLGLDLGGGGAADFVALGYTENDVLAVANSPQVPVPTSIALLATSVLSLLTFLWFNGRA